MWLQTVKKPRQTKPGGRAVRVVTQRAVMGWSSPQRERAGRGSVAAAFSLLHFQIAVTRHSNVLMEGDRSPKVSVQRNVSLHTCGHLNKKWLCDGKTALRKFSSRSVTAVLCSARLWSFSVAAACTALSFHSFSCNLLKHRDEGILQRRPLTVR